METRDREFTFSRFAVSVMPGDRHALQRRNIDHEATRATAIKAHNIADPK